MNTSSRKLRSFHLALRKELAARFRVDPDHPGIERILEETEAHLEDTIAELVEGGANRSLLMRVVLKEGALLALFGLALAASLFFAELVSGMLYDVAPTDVATLGLVALTLILVALLASAVPAWRTSEIDPVQALREE